MTFKLVLSLERIGEGLVTYAVPKDHVILSVWTNGKAVRAYTGQDKVGPVRPAPDSIEDGISHEVRGTHHTPDAGWYKATAIIVRQEGQ